MGNLGSGETLPGDIILSIVKNFETSGYQEDVLKYLTESYSILHLDNSEGVDRWLRLIYKVLFPLNKAASVQLMDDSDKFKLHAN